MRSKDVTSEGPTEDKNIGLDQREDKQHKKDPKRKGAIMRLA